MATTQGVGANAIVPFSYTGTQAYQVVTIGFAPSWILASAATQTWIWNSSLSSGQAIGINSSNVALVNVNGAGQVAADTGLGAGFFVGTSTNTNATSLTFNGIAVR